MPTVSDHVRVKAAPGSAAFACILALGVAATLLPVPPAMVERWYSGSIYPQLQRVMTTMSNSVPFALFDALIILGPILWLAWLVRDLRRLRPWPRALGRWALRTAAAVATLYLVFLGAWGLNYRRVPLEQKLPYDATAVTAAAARETAQLAALRLNALYVAAHAALPDDVSIDATLAPAFARATRELGARGTTVPARPKQTVLDPYFRRAGVAGMTDPFFLETLLDGDLLPVERAFVIAHEWSHLAGFADEGEANFAGWLTCMRAGVPVQYSGWLFLFGELVNGLPRSDRAGVVARLDAGPRADLRAIAERLARDVRPAVAATGWRVYDRYLKANRVEAGAASYAQVVRLVLGTRIGLTAPEATSRAR
jgi:hypothetical protein